MSTALQAAPGLASQPPVATGAPSVVPELLAPAGDWECAKAAVENGADAIYFGLDRFNARMRAKNFTEADLPALMEFLHRRGVKGYVTFNTLVFTDELADAADYLRSIIAAGVDAAIVQDVGIARLIRRLSPDFPIHASTQMTITSAAGVAFARELGCNLVVLARECSIKEIEAIRAPSNQRSAVSGQQEGVRAPQAESCSLNADRSLPLEVFVHGALCVAYSGQCLTSEALGGRSANRGECAQACRMPYELISDGKKVELGGRNYLLSPQDLAGLDVLPDLVRAGVTSLKIEGRLKSPEYVASITRIYRQALDELGTRNAERGKGMNTQPATGDRQYELEMAFSRGLSTGWFEGIDNQKLVHARFGKKRGAFVGEVTRVAGDRVHVRLGGSLKAGDGIVFDPGHGGDDEEGGRVFEMRNAERGTRNDEAVLTFMPGAVNFVRVHVGDKLWKTSDAELEKRVRATFAGDTLRFQRPITIEVHGHVGAPLTLIARDEQGHVAQAQSTAPLAAAEKQPLTTERLTEQLGRLGGTPFKFGELRNQLEGAVIIPVSELNRLRREVAAELERQRALPKQWKLRPVGRDSVEPHLERSEASAASISAGGNKQDSRYARASFVGNLGSTESHPTNAVDASRASELLVLVRTLPQLEAALRCGVTTIYCELEDPKRYREAVQMARDNWQVTSDSPELTAPATSPAIRHPSPSIFVAPPRITKSGEEWILKQVRSCNADGYLVRNYDHLDFFADCRRVGDFSLNIANPLTAEHFMNRFGLERLTASYDLNISQLESLLRGAPPAWFEVTIHQHMPMFHMEHCVFCAFLSKGKDFRDCGRPCDHHDVRVRDRVGQEHPLKADAGCRNTVFNARAQTGAEFVGRLQTLGVRRFRIEFVNESPEEVATTIARYRGLLRGELTGEQLWRELKLHHQLGVTRGQMEGEARIARG